MPNEMDNPSRASAAAGNVETKTNEVLSARSRSSRQSDSSHHRQRSKRPSRRQNMRKAVARKLRQLNRSIADERATTTNMYARMDSLRDEMKNANDEADAMSIMSDLSSVSSTAVSESDVPYFFRHREREKSAYTKASYHRTRSDITGVIEDQMHSSVSDRNNNRLLRKKSTNRRDLTRGDGKPLMQKSFPLRQTLLTVQQRWKTPSPAIADDLDQWYHRKKSDLKY